MGESQNQPFQLSFNRFLRVDFQGSRVISDGGLILVREPDEQIGLSGLIGKHLVDSRTGRNAQFPLADRRHCGLAFIKENTQRTNAKLKSEIPVQT